MRSLVSQNKTVLMIISALVFILYGNSLKNKYALDDEYITVTNFDNKIQQYIPNHKLVSKGFAGLSEIWKSNYAVDNESSFDYRPVTTSTFAIEYGFFGQNPFVSHLVNLLLYAFTCMLLYLTILKLFVSHKLKVSIALTTCLLFLILPVHTEVVNNLKCRDELLGLFFILSGLFYGIDIYDKPRLKPILIVVLSIALAIFSKPSGILAIPVILLSIFTLRTFNAKKAGVLTGILLLVFAATEIAKGQLITHTEIRHFYGFENPLYTTPAGFSDRIVIAFKTMGFYIKSMIYPLPFRFYYGTNTFDISSQINAYFFLALFVIIAAGYYIYKTRNKYFIFGFLFFIGTIFPFLNFITPVAGIVGERLGYIASVGFALTVAIVLADKLPAKYLLKLPVLSGANLFYSPLIIVCAFLVCNRNPNWQSKLTLFEHDIPELKESAKANSLLANEYFEMLRMPKPKYPPQQVIQKCLFHYSASVGIDSSFYSAYNNAGVVYYSYLNDMTNASRFFRLAIRHKDRYNQAYENLGNCYKNTGKHKEAEAMYLKAISINSRQYTAYKAWIEMLFADKEYDKVILILKYAKQIFKNNYELFIFEANCYLMKNQLKESLDYYEKAYALNPNKELAGYISSKYMEIGNATKSLEYKNK